MARSVEEWIGKTDNAKIPNRVRVRVFLGDRGRCAICSRTIPTGETWECDHIKSLVNGGEHRESNLQVLCEPCHKGKTALDVAIKAKTYAIQKKHLGLKQSKGRPLPGTKRSGIRKRMSGKVESW